MTLNDEGSKGNAVDCHQIEEQQMIERYLDGTLPETEVEAFEEHYFGCQHCFSELQLRHAAAIELTSQSAQKASRPAAKTKSFYFWALAAAAVLVLALTSVWVIRQRSPVDSTPSTAVLVNPQQKLFEELARIEEAPSYLQATIRGGVAGPAQEKLRQGMQLYQQGKYAEAVPYLRPASESNPELYPSRFYLGISLLMVNQNDEAIQTLLSLVNSTSNPYLEDSQWYLAKAYFRKKDVKAGKEHLEAVVRLDGPHAEEASRIVGLIESSGKESH